MLHKLVLGARLEVLRELAILKRRPAGTAGIGAPPTVPVPALQDEREIKGITSHRPHHLPDDPRPVPLRVVVNVVLPIGHTLLLLGMKKGAPEDSLTHMLVLLFSPSSSTHRARVIRALWDAAVVYDVAPNNTSSERNDLLRLPRVVRSRRHVLVETRMVRAWRPTLGARGKERPIHQLTRLISSTATIRAIEVMPIARTASVFIESPR